MSRIFWPPIVGFVLVAALVAAEAAGYRGLSMPAAQTIPEAVAIGDAARVLELIAQGQGPNARAHIREGIIDGQAYDVLPLEAAVMGRRGELITLLLRSGARIDDRDRLVCLARARFPGALPIIGVDPEADRDRILDPGVALSSCPAKP